MPPIRPLPPQADLPATSPLRPRSPDVVAAQRAFFNAALGKAAPAAATPQVMTSRSVAEASAPIRPAGAAAPSLAPQPAGDAAPPNRIARPGSVIDIKV